MTIAIIGGSAETEQKAETVRPWIRSPARTVTIVTPAGKWRSAFRNSSDEITRISSSPERGLSSALPILPHGSAGRGIWLAQFIVRPATVARTGKAGPDHETRPPGGNDNGQDEEGFVGREGGAEPARARGAVHGSLVDGRRPVRGA